MTAKPPPAIYHICQRNEWKRAQDDGSYSGSSQDRADGFIHFSARDQVEASAAKHRVGQDGLVLLAVNSTTLGEALRWEASRGGALFPHLYGELPRGAVIAVHDLPLAATGRHIFPQEY